MTIPADLDRMVPDAAVGFVLGLAYFGGLWWTVARTTSGRSGAWLLPVSSLVRTALLLGGFWYISHGQASGLVACVAGWLLARQAMIRRLGPVAKSSAKGGSPCI